MQDPSDFDRFVFIHSKPYWKNFCEPRKVFTDPEGFVRLNDAPGTIVVIDDSMPIDAEGLVAEPSERTASRERMRDARGQKSAWLSWWDKKVAERGAV